MSRMPLRRGNCAWQHLVALCIAIFVGFPSALTAADARKVLPDHVPPKRSSQIEDGFGINSDLPREPYLPWNRWWWTRMFDAGFKWKIVPTAPVGIGSSRSAACIQARRSWRMR